ncbi:ferrous iron transport protein A [Caenimonas terrae]|uniref:Ferrous iron transport protein A n=1 Tax=Caenimonas terrae TaxID=696074 RepID=A0ABW0NG35_9BURK
MSRRFHAQMPTSSEASRLHQAPLRRQFAVRRVLPDDAVPERERQLEELGFYAGEQVMVMSRGFPGGDPLVVRIGASTFALRGAEAACVEIEPLGPAPAP